MNVNFPLYILAHRYYRQHLKTLYSHQNQLCRLVSSGMYDKISGDLWDVNTQTHHSTCRVPKEQHYTTIWLLCDNRFVLLGWLPLWLVRILEKCPGHSEVTMGKVTFRTLNQVYITELGSVPMNSCSEWGRGMKGESEWMYEWVSKCVSEWVSELVSEWVLGSTWSSLKVFLAKVELIPAST